MHFYPFIYGYKTKNIVTGNRVAAVCHFIIQFVFIFSENKLVKLFGNFFLVNIFGFIRFSDSILEETYKSIASRSSKILQFLVFDDAGTNAIIQIQTCFHFEENHKLVYSAIVQIYFERL